MDGGHRPARRPCHPRTAAAPGYGRPSCRWPARRMGILTITVTSPIRRHMVPLGQMHRRKTPVPRKVRRDKKTISRRGHGVGAKPTEQERRSPRRRDCAAPFVARSVGHHPDQQSTSPRRHAPWRAPAIPARQKPAPTRRDQDRKLPQNGSLRPQVEAPPPRPSARYCCLPIPLKMEPLLPPSYEWPVEGPKDVHHHGEWRHAYCPSSHPHHQVCARRPQGEQRPPTRQHPVRRAVVGDGHEVPPQSAIGDAGSAHPHDQSVSPLVRRYDSEHGRDKPRPQRFGMVQVDAHILPHVQRTLRPRPSHMLKDQRRRHEVSGLPRHRAMDLLKDWLAWTRPSRQAMSRRKGTSLQRESLPLTSKPFDQPPSGSRKPPTGASCTWERFGFRAAQLATSGPSDPAQPGVRGPPGPAA